MTSDAHTDLVSEGPKTGGEIAYVRLRQDIVSGVLMPGQKLKIEMLKERYNLSNGPLREAMSRLSAEYLIEQSGQRGFRVAPLSVRDAREIGELRLLVEVQALRRSIERSNEAWEEKVITTFFRLEQVERNAFGQEVHVDWERLNGAFHDALVARCDSVWLLRTRSAMFRHHERYRRLSRAKTVMTRDIHKEHRALRDAALARNCDEAEALITSHVKATTEAVASALSQGAVFEAC